MGKTDRKVKSELKSPAARSGGIELDSGSRSMAASGTISGLERPWTPSAWQEEIALLRRAFKEEPEIVLWAGPKHETHERIQMLDRILAALAAQRLSYTWLILGDSGTMFKGQTPYEYCVAGGLPAMVQVLALLQ
jgi:hypothetical protein